MRSLRLILLTLVVLLAICIRVAFLVGHDEIQKFQTLHAHHFNSGSSGSLPSTASP
jgi:hypothetical protein